MSIKVTCPACGKSATFSKSDEGMVTLCVACGARYWVRDEVETPSDPFAAAPDAAAAAESAPPPPTDASSGIDASAAALGDLNVDDDIAAADALALALGGRPAGAPMPAFPDSAPAGAVEEEVPPATARPFVSSVYTPKPPIATLTAEGSATPPKYDPAAAERPAPRMRPGLVYALLGGAAALVVILGVIVVVATRPRWEENNAATVHELKSQAEGFSARQRYQDAYDTYARLDALVAGRQIRDAKLRAEVERAREDRDWLIRVLVTKAQGQYATVTLPETTTTTTPTTTQAAAGNAPQNASGSPATRPQSVAAPATVPATSASPPVFDGRPRRGRSRPPTTQFAVSPTWLARPAVRVWPLDEGARGEAAGELTDEAIGRAIERGVNHLIGQFKEGKLRGFGGTWGDALQTGRNALCAYALLQASYAIKDDRLNPKGPFVRELLDGMKAMPADGNHAIYARAIRATALALVGRPEDRGALLADAAYLIASHRNGAYTYSKPEAPAKGQEPGPIRWDNSNSQYGLLGVWAAAEVGAEVNSTYWQAVEEHWTRYQNRNGSWEYAGSDPIGPGKVSMALAGVASLLVTHDYLDAPRIGGEVGREPFSPALARGLAYLESGDTAVNLTAGGGYSLYGLERVGLASGFKYFGAHDWYRVLAADLVRRQAAEGTWSFAAADSVTWDETIETAFDILFLARGRHPILMNKLRYDGPWANRPRDLANLARFGTRELERPLNWQVVPLARDWTDWMDAPILYVSTHRPVPLADADLDKLRSYARAGGMLFTQADGSSVEADLWAQALAARLFPEYPMKELPPEHELFGVLYKPGDRPPLKYVTNGSRILMLHSPTDLTQHWQMRSERTRRGLFELGMNLFLYASGKSDLRNRLTSPVMAEPGEPPAGGRVAVARVQYAGNWDPEPAAWPRFGRYFHRETDVGLDVAPTGLANLNAHVAGFAHWTGTAAYAATDAEVAAIRKYVEEGGVLLIEPTGGSSEFFESARAAVRRAFPEAQAQMVGKGHPMLTASGPAMDDLSRPLVRPYVKSRGYGTGGRIDAVTFGRGKVILSPLDLTTGLLGCNTWGVLGFDPAYSLKLMKNVVVWSATGMAEER
jgi:hypothetical protein